MPPFVQIIVLNWNGAQDTLRCIDSLELQTYPNFGIVIVDNGSTDASLQNLARLGARVTLMALPNNLGFTGGNNVALHHAFDGGAAYAWLFNNDATADPAALARLVDACEADPAIGLAGPLVLEEHQPDGNSPAAKVARPSNGPERADDAMHQSGCGLIDLGTPHYSPSHSQAESQMWQDSFPQRIVVHGTALLIRRSLYQAIGGLDDSFFAYWEDIDYSIRSAAAGFRNLMLVDAVIYHGSKPTQAAPESIKPHYYYFMARNELLLWRKFCPGSSFTKAAVWNLHRQLRQIVRMPSNAGGIDAILAGLWHGWRGSGGRYDPRRRMPAPLRSLLRRFPRFWFRVLGGKKSAPLI